MPRKPSVRPPMISTGTVLWRSDREVLISDYSESDRAKFVRCWAGWGWKMESEGKDGMVWRKSE